MIENIEDIDRDCSLLYWLEFWLSAGVTGLLVELLFLSL